MYPYPVPFPGGMMGPSIPSIATGASLPGSYTPISGAMAAPTLPPPMYLGSSISNMPLGSMPGMLNNSALLPTNSYTQTPGYGHQTPTPAPWGAPWPPGPGPQLAQTVQMPPTSSASAQQWNQQTQASGPSPSQPFPQAIQHTQFTQHVQYTQHTQQAPTPPQPAQPLQPQPPQSQPPQPQPPQPLQPQLHPAQPSLPPPPPVSYPPAPFPQPPLPNYPQPHQQPQDSSPVSQPATGSVQGPQGQFLSSFPGKKVAILTGVDPENSDAASRGCTQMEAFLKRNGYVATTILFADNDWSAYRSRIEKAVQELIRNARPGDSCFLYCIGYDCTAALRELVDKLPRGLRLVCVFDCCYVTEKPAFRIHHADNDPNRVAQAMAPITDYPAADIFLFEGMAEIRCVAWFKSAKGNTPLYTAGFIRALSRGPEGYWGKPSTPSFVRLSEDVETEIASIVHRLPKDALPKMTSLICCTRAYNVDQPFVL